jgi:hypothetical protein
MIIDNIDGLIEDIDRGYDIYCSAGPRSHRLGAALQLQVALNLLSGMVPAERLAPLFSLHEQLMALNWGIAGEMFKPDDWGRKPPIPHREAYERAHLAALMHFLMEVNRRAGGRGDKKESAKKVGRRFNVGYQQVDAWRQHAMEESSENDPLAYRFHQLLKAFDDPNQAANELMRAPKGAHMIG